jgi:NAD(P)-dependent dehydrogenase (short-subunit alcohol dehydrogenase family)
MELGIKDRRALITGGGRGIGKAIALALAEEGVSVCIVSRTESELGDVCNEIKDKGGKAIYKVLDLSDQSALENFKTEIYDEIGGIDIIINNAAHVSNPKRLALMEDKEWYKTIDIDLNATYRLIRLFLDDMKNNKWGRIISIGSLSGIFGASSYPAYCAAKAALDGLSKNLAIDYSKFGITVNLISPGFVETERFKKAAPKELIDKFIGATSSKRLGKPEDISNAVLFLASEKSTYITGINLEVCGGLNLGNFW